MTLQENRKSVTYVKTSQPRNPPKDGVQILVLSEGEKIKGTLVGVFASIIEGYKPEMVVENEETKYSLSMNSSLYKQVEWKGVQIGHEIEVEFSGTLKSKEKGKAPMNLFKINNITQPNTVRKVDPKFAAISGVSKSTVVDSIEDDEIDL